EQLYTYYRPTRRSSDLLSDLGVDAQSREHMRGLIGTDRAGRSARGRDTEALEFEEHGLSGGVREAERGMVRCPRIRVAREEGSRNRGQDRGDELIADGPDASGGFDPLRLGEFECGGEGDRQCHVLRARPAPRLLPAAVD